MNKQDILDLGWIYIGGFWYEWPVKDTIYCDEFSNRTLDFRLCFSNIDKYIIMEAYERNSFDWERIYAGPCKEPAQLWLLMDWFNIKKLN